MRALWGRGAAAATFVCMVMLLPACGSSGDGDERGASGLGRSEGPLASWSGGASTPGATSGAGTPGASGVSTSGTAAGTTAPGTTSGAGTPGGATEGSSAATSAGPSSPGGSHSSPQKVRRCGRTVDEGTANGRRQQVLVFPRLGTDHRYPDRTVALRGCATSGLPVHYELAPGSGCEPLRASPTSVSMPESSSSGGCTVVASQPGDATWAAAAPVSRKFFMNLQYVRLEWADSQTQMRAGPAKVRIRIVSSGTFKAGRLSVNPDGNCTVNVPADQSYFTTNGESVFPVPVTFTKPDSGVGKCTLSAAIQNDHSGFTQLAGREYTVS